MFSLLPQDIGSQNKEADEQVEAYTTLFEDKNKYKAMMSVLAAQLFKEVRQQVKNAKL
jgi:hypothetical protein